MSLEPPLIGAIEGGGTKMVCAVGTGPEDLRSITRIDTTTPEETLDSIARYFLKMRVEHGPVAAIGLGCFGPLDLDPKSEGYGYITTTPKPGWQQVDIVGILKSRLKVPFAFDTDVNAAALGEHLWGAGIDCDPLVYITIGTGVGGGVFVNGQLLHGLVHPEIGHLSIPQPSNSSAVSRDCQCPYHRSCVEGYVSGTSMAKRWGVRADQLPPDHLAWEEMSDTLGHALMNLVLTLSPKKIILGGGVMDQPHLIGLVRGKLRSHLNGYVAAPQLGSGIDQYVVKPGLGSRSGLIGSLALGMQLAAAQGQAA
jgi:fructokinase